MTFKRTTMFLVGGAALAAWLSAAMTPGRSAAPRLTITPAPMDASGAELSREIGRLHERLRPTSPPNAPVRNPFTFGSAGRSDARRNGAATNSPTASAPVVNRVPDFAPRFVLSGIAEDPGTDGPIRTAIISADDHLFLAKEEDTIAVQGVSFTVRGISSESVDLIDTRDGSRRRLTLR
jgi:hypothetical protein